MNGTPKVISGPAYVAASATDVYTPPASTIISIIRQIHLANVTSSSATVTLYRGGTNGSTGGTELCKGLAVAANEVRDLFFDDLVMKSTDFLSGLASAGSTITITVIGHQIVTP